MAVKVPAYKDFLAKNKIPPEKIKSIADFRLVPPLDKENYLRSYPLEDLCWDGKFSSESWVISSSSGTTGEPFYFPRTKLQDEYYAIVAELYLRENFSIHKKTTLYINAFAMGAWIGGVFTYQAITTISRKGYALSIISPGIDKKEVIKNIQILGPKFDQIIIGSYPPFMREIISYGCDQDLDWSKYNIGLIFSAEGFSENFRSYIAMKSQINLPLLRTLNHYGTVDMGTMSHETAISNFVRQRALKLKPLFIKIFRSIQNEPTLTQYLPELFYFEAINSSLMCSSCSGIPLIRYSLKDKGGILKYKDIESAFTAHEMRLDSELKRDGLIKYKWNLPFVYLYERSDHAVVFMGSQIYPEVIKTAFLDKRIADYLTGKFAMCVKYDNDYRDALEINVELSNGSEFPPFLTNLICELIVECLVNYSSEYQTLIRNFGKVVYPTIRVWPNAHPDFFAKSNKHSWSVKDHKEKVLKRGQND